MNATTRVLLTALMCTAAVACSMKRKDVPPADTVAGTTTPMPDTGPTTPGMYGPDESPSFAPNASMILYATREGSRGVLYVVSADARVRQRLVLADGDVREPAWGLYRQQH